MANEFIKAQKVVSTALGMLAREVVLPSLVWRDAGGSFIGAAGDTISIRLPAYVNARTRTLRAGRPITVDSLDETKVDVTLDTDVYKAIGVTDEEMTLDIVDFGMQVLTPVVSSVVRGIEDALADEMTSATYEVNETIDPSDPYLAITAARRALNDANVPLSNRFLAMGTGVEQAFLESDRFSKFDSTGDTSNTALREAVIGRIAGFTGVVVPGLDPDVMIAGHKTAFVLSMQAPLVPDGAAWGTSQSYNGFAMRALRDYDFVNVQDRLLADVFTGTNTVKDRGTIDGNGKFQPSVDGTGDPILVRAVKCTLSGS